eukprot:COSAG02_NODE_25334_length_661_cov_1.777580_1_plen_129_part_01
MLRMVRHCALLLLLLTLMVADPSSSASTTDRETIRQHIARALALKDSKSWDDSIGEFRKVLTMRSAADHATWAEATDGMNALCHGQYACLIATRYCPDQTPGIVQHTHDCVRAVGTAQRCEPLASHRRG